MLYLAHNFEIQAKLIVEGVMAQHPQADDVCNEKIIMVGT
jgi:hypothetical protein